MVFQKLNLLDPLMDEQINSILLEDEEQHGGTRSQVNCGGKSPPTIIRYPLFSINNY